MNNDPNNINNNSSIENLNEPVVSSQPVAPVQPEPVTQVKPEAPASPVERQMGINPHQHVNMDELTPRTIFETSANNATKSVTPPDTPTAPVEVADPVNNKPKEKSSAFPLIILILVIGVGGYFLYNQFFQQEEPVSSYQEGDTEQSTQSSGDVQLMSGLVLYLTENGGIGMNGVYFKYVSHTSSQIVVNVSINDGTPKEYTIPFGKKTKIDHVKNPIIIKKEDSFFAITFI